MRSAFCLSARFSISVLNPASQGRSLQLFKLPGTDRIFSLQQVIPSHFQNPWTAVAFALVAATVLKGIFDYAGTYLVNYAGFGMITDLRDDLYNAFLRSSAAFFTKHTTGTLLSTIINDIERVQYAMSTRAGGIPATVLHASFYRRPGRRSAGWKAGLGAAARSFRSSFIRRERLAGRCAARLAAGRTSWRRSRTFCTRPSPATAS